MFFDKLPDSVSIVVEELVNATKQIMEMIVLLRCMSWDLVALKNVIVDCKEILTKR